ncbi:FtsX-like permease family protein [Hydrogenophaga sp. PAMC20947]|uniref:ABC transporter permease n=1 Tax=Hydrogenophaga sp. PAMC20947 TaxID=2565558 RepID=UPI00109E19B9|nr:FtsX-like permease family protein [Hydrogenophaga sp. PAMC20947]QCB46142.1 FtsX-like permease family protein [Hydrogenophaga sp. PAMC20947]
MRFLFSLAWRDLRASGRQLWIFVACLLLGVSLVAAGGGLYRQVADALRADARLLFGGDVEVESAQPLPPEVLAWMLAPGEGAATVSRLIELRTMLRSEDGHAQLIELQSADAAYPLYGQVTLAPAGTLDTTLAERGGAWGAALDATLAQRMDLSVGDTVEVGDLSLTVRALITRQPDRSLRADWGAAPVLVADGALIATGLVQPLSRIDYRYRVRTEQPPSTWRDAFVAAFPALDAEVDTFDERSERMAEVLGQIGSGLLLIGFSALFIGGLGVFNSVQAYLQGKLTSLATLRALGLRDGRLAAMVLIQIVMLALLASAAGVLLGNALALAGALATADRLPIALLLNGLWQPSLVALAFGVLTAVVFALPALGRALSVTPAALFRGVDGVSLRTPRRAWLLTGAVALAVVALLVVALPDPRFGLGFVLATAALLALLEGLTRGLRVLAGRLQASKRWSPPLAMQLALANLQQPASPLRPALLSLGSALTLLVACTLVVTTLLRTVNETVPANAPALVFYDVQTEQIPLLQDTLNASPGLQQVRTAPLVLGRLAAVNGEALRDSGDGARAREARDEHKLSNQAGNFDDVVVVRGTWWPEGHRGKPLVAMEDREADQLGLQVGDQLRFDILGTPVAATLSAIYSQRRMQSRLWLEAIFSDGVLDPFITRHVGAAYMPAEESLAAQDRLAAAAPNIATVRTESVLRETRALMARASRGLAVVALVCLAASLLVLGSVVAASRSRQVYDATVMHALGARHSMLRRVLIWEYALLAFVTAGFAIVAGSALATGLLRWRLDMDPLGLYWSGALTAVAVSVISLGLGAHYLLRQMQINPALLLRSSG